MRKKSLYDFILKIIKYLIVLLSLLFLLLLGLSVIISKFYSDQLKEMAVEQINSNLKTEFHAKELSISVVSHFPMVSLEMEDFYLHEPAHEEDTLIYAEVFYLNFNIIDMIKRNYNVRNMGLSRGFCNLKVNKEGEDNFSVFNSKQNNSNQQFKFLLEELNFNDFHIKYDNKLLQQDYVFVIKESRLNGEFNNASFEIETEANLLVDQFLIENVNFISKKEADLKLILQVNNDPTSVQIKKGILGIEAMNFTVNGNYNLKSSENLDLHIKGDAIKLEEIFSVFPLDYLYILNRYHSKGNLVFDAHLQGELSNNKPLFFLADFSVENGEFIDRENNIEFSDISLDGSFNNQQKTLDISSFRGELAGDNISGKLLVHGFDNPNISTELRGDLSLDKAAFFTNSNELKMTGNSTFEIQLNMHLMEDKIIPKKCSGTVTIPVGDIKYLPYNLDMKFNDLFLDFHSNQLAFSANKIKIKEDDFSLSLKLSDWQNVLFKNSKRLNFLGEFNFDQFNSSTWLALVSKISEPSDSSANYDVSFKGKFNADKLNYENATFKNVQMRDVSYQENIKIKNVSAEGQGGSYRFSKIDINDNKEGIKLKVNGEMEKVSVDKLLNEFDNFSQDFITGNQLKGELSSVFSSTVTIPNNEDFDISHMEFNAKNKYHQFKLIEYSYLKELIGYFNESVITRNIVDIPYYESKVKKVSFKDFNNTISLKNGKFIISPSRLDNNVLNLNVYGSQTLSDSVEYHMNFNWKEIKKKNKKSKEEYLEEKESGKELYLHIYGHLDNLKYKFDREKIKTERVEKIKEEKEIVKKILQGEEIIEEEKPPTFEVNWEEEDSTNKEPAIDSVPKKTKKKKDSSKLNKFLKKIGVEDQKKEKPKFVIDQ